MGYIEGDNGGGAVWDSLAQFYVSIAIIWTSFLLAGSAYLIINRRVHCIRIRNLPLALSAVACLHAYWILCLVAYSMNGTYPCDAEYWVMSIYLPLGIALFQANSMQLLSVYGVQEKLLQAGREPHNVKNIYRSIRSRRRQLLDWKNMSLLKRTEMGIAVGMVVQLVVSLSVFLASRKFHSFGSVSVPVTPSECRRGPEWIPSILWQLSWSWIFAPYILWKIRNINDIHYWRIQITICAIAGLPGSPMWLAALYSHSPIWATINKYWLPPLWFTPGILAMEAVTIFLPCYELLVTKRYRYHLSRTMESWEDKAGALETNADSTLSHSQSGACTTSSTITRGDEMYSRKALDKCLAENSSALLLFAASKEFTGENILFLTYVRDWKEAWMKVSQSKPEFEGEQELGRDPRAWRLYFFKIAVEIYAACVNLRTAEFPINIESNIYSNLIEIFGETAQTIARPGSRQSITTFPYKTKTPDYAKLGSSIYMAQMTASHQHHKKQSSIIMVDDDTNALSQDFYRSQSIMHIEPRTDDDVVIPEKFDITCFDEAETSVKRLVYTNTWPKFVDYTYDTMSINTR